MVYALCSKGQFICHAIAVVATSMAVIAINFNCN